MNDHDLQACHDQHMAGVRDYAYACMGIRDEFVKFDFTKEEAFTLLLTFLDKRERDHAST